MSLKHDKKGEGSEEEGHRHMCVDLHLHVYVCTFVCLSL